MEGIDDNYILKAIESLEEEIGIKESIGGREIVSLIQRNKVKEGIKEIAKQLSLPIENGKGDGVN